MSSADKKGLYETVATTETKTALLVYTKKTKVTEFLKRELEKYFTVYETTSIYKLPNKKIDHYIFVNIAPHSFSEYDPNVTVIFIRFFLTHAQFDQEAIICKKQFARYKYVNIGVTGHSLEETLRFVLFKTPTPYVFNYASHFHNPLPKHTQKPFHMPWKQIFLGILVLFVITCFLYAVAEVITVWSLLYKKPKQATLSYSAANALFTVPRQTLFWIPGSNTIINTHEAIGNTLRVAQAGVALASTPLSFEDKELKEKIALLQVHLAETVTAIDTAIASWQQPLIPGIGSVRTKVIDTLETAKEYAAIGKDIAGVAPRLLGENGKKKYLILFMNNMELRPGGGFIGSLAVVEVNKYKIISTRIYDVYSLDGQLKTHFDPPYPIKTYLEQPHWFLRDSNTSPDFIVSGTNAVQFLQNSVGWNNFDGVIGVTYSAVSSALPAFPKLFVPDYKETVTEETFFQKAHQYAQGDFFSGSHGKRNFLQAVATALLVRLEEHDFDPTVLVKSIRQSLDEKQITLSFVDPEIEKIVQKNFWGGQLTPPNCVTPDPCVPDYVSLIDMNVGVNKANFYVQRLLQLKTTIEESGVINNTVAVTYRNESAGSPGGVYKNYMQLYVPAETHLQGVTLDGKEMQDVRQTLEGPYRVYGLLVVVPEGEQRIVVVNYTLDKKLTDESNYQVIVQKQIGSINNDFVYEFSPGPNHDVVQTNFQNVVRAGHFVYNTFLEKDRLLLIRLKKS